ncbi:ventral homeobox [Solea solea]|uniref:ventral homeobox n=1 Tax=Solea solea TaxID=90069 RepID=UPI00272CC8C5|nr:ventral homeobox [Solea solea]
MVKYFSVDWLAQSHRDTTTTGEHELGTDTALTHRPHMPCVVQPRPPTFGKGYLQPKPKPTKPVDLTEQMDNNRPLDSTLCSSPTSEISGYSSGYESEATSSECHSMDEEKDGPQRRVRTKFTPEQINKLEKIFNKHKYLDAGERVKTAQKLSLTETQIRTWFQNRRMKLKREVQDYHTPQVPSVMFQSLPPVQYHMMGQQRPHYPAAGPHYYPISVPQMVLQQPMSPHPPPHRLMIHNPHYY